MARTYWKNVPCSDRFRDALDTLNNQFTDPPALDVGAEWAEFATRSARLRKIDHDYRAAFAKLREEFLLPTAKHYVTPHKTLIYSSLEIDVPAIVLTAPTGQPTYVDRLIHLSEPVNPEDRWLREQNVHCAEIINFLICGIDKRPPHQSEHNGRQQLSGQKWRETLLARQYLT